MFSDSYILYPFSNPNRMIGLGLLLCTSFLVIPAVLAGGYFLKIIENTIKGNYELPSFEKWTKMFADGLKVAAVILFYFLPGLSLEFVMSLLLHSKYALILDGWFILGLFVLTVILYISAYILAITAIPRMAYKNRLKAALDVKMVIMDIKDIGLKKYAFSLIGLSIMAIYLIVFATYFLQLFTYIDNFLIGFVIGIFAVNLMVYSLLIASQGRLMGLIYLERT